MKKTVKKIPAIALAACMTLSAVAMPASADSSVKIDKMIFRHGADQVYTMQQGDLSAKARVTNSGTAIENAFVLFSAEKNGKLEKIDISRVSIPSGTSDIESKMLSSLDAGSEAKYMLWDASFHPLCNVEKLNDVSRDTRLKSFVCDSPTTPTDDANSPVEINDYTNRIKVRGYNLYDQRDINNVRSITAVVNAQGATVDTDLSGITVLKTGQEVAVTAPNGITTEVYTVYNDEKYQYLTDASFDDSAMTEGLPTTSTGDNGIWQGMYLSSNKMTLSLENKGDTADKFLRLSKLSDTDGTTVYKHHDAFSSGYFVTEFDLRVNSIANDGFYFGTGDTSNPFLRMNIHTDGDEFRLTYSSTGNAGYGTTVCSLPVDSSDNGWHRIKLITYMSSKTTEVFIDGMYDDTITAFNASAPSSMWSNYFFIASYSGGYGVIDIDNVKVGRMRP